MELPTSRECKKQDIKRKKNHSWPLREEAVNHASKQLFTYISAKARERQKKAKKSVTSAIVLDDAQTVDTTETKWWIESLNLLDSDKQTLTSGAWLNASIITACQVILASQFNSKSGFQDVVHGILMDFSIQTECFIQILHDADRNHWVVFTNVASTEPEELSSSLWYVACFHIAVLAYMHRWHLYCILASQGSP